MISLTAHGISNVIGGKLVSGPFDRVASGGVCTDSRHLPPHAVFFALGGEKFDGNLFAPEASRTAAAVVVSRVEEGMDPSCAVILVEDTLEALQKLAAWWRSELTLTVIGLTGSNGKTSTKDLTASVLSQGFRTIATQGNLNNHIGVPLSILRATPSDEAAVWEMGMNHSGELAPLCEMTRPKIGIITSIGTSHMEYLGSRENIAREKCTLARCLPEDGFMIFPADCDYADMIRQSTRAACIDCGIDAGTVRAENPVSTENGTDTAGRLHTRHNLMEELSKIRRTLAKQDASAPHSTLLVVDATTGANALAQAREFHKATPLDSVIITKMDGSGKGGVAVAIMDEMHISPSFLGTGEEAEDFEPFNRDRYVDSLL